MTKQEEIKKELDRLFYEAMRLSPFQNTNVLFSTNRSRANHKAKIYTEKAIYGLHSQGVVIKVERAKSPDDLIAVEPLIKDMKADAIQT